MSWRLGDCVQDIRAVSGWVPIPIILVFLTSAAMGADASIGSILSNPAQFDGKIVTIRGTAAAVNQTISRSGNAYSTFQVQDASGNIKVFTWGHPGIKSRDGVQVTGVFQQVKRVRQYTFYNEIEAHSITPIAR